MPQVSSEELEKLRELDRKTKERYRKQNEYLAEKYDRINFTVPAGGKEKIREAATRAGMSVNEFCSRAVLSAANGPEDSEEKPINDNAEEKDSELPEFMRD